MEGYYFWSPSTIIDFHLRNLRKRYQRQINFSQVSAPFLSEFFKTCTIDNLQLHRQVLVPGHHPHQSSMLFSHTGEYISMNLVKISYCACSGLECHWYNKNCDNGCSYSWGHFWFMVHLFATPLFSLEYC